MILFNNKISCRIGLFLGGAVTIGWLAWISRNDLVIVSKNIRLWYFLIAVLFGVAFTTVQGTLFALLMIKNGSKANLSDLVSAFLLSQPGKYIPGKIWSVMMQSLALKDLNNFSGIAIANMELTLIIMIQMITLGLACLSLHLPLMVLAVLIFGVTLSTIIALLPTAALLSRISARLAMLFRVNPPEINYRSSLFWRAILLSSIVIICNFATSLMVLFSAGSFIGYQQYGPILSSLYFAFAASLLVVPIPAGVGVREAATIGVGLLVAPEISSAVLVSIALLTRCWQLLVDALCLGFGAMILLFSPSLKK